MSSEISKILTKGLRQGFAGIRTPADIERGSFKGKGSHIDLGEEGIYDDRWFADTLGGGQELVRVGEKMFTRLYGGGTVSPEKLAELEITAGDVFKYLKKKILELGDKTRLFEECKPVPDGEWQYLYEIIMKDPNIPVILSAESIMYKNTRVHLHPFILSPII